MLEIHFSYLCISIKNSKVKRTVANHWQLTGAKRCRAVHVLQDSEKREVYLKFAILSAPASTKLVEAGFLF